MNPFKHASKSKNMNSKVAIILIILAGTISSVAYATTTVISDTGIITSDLTVTGTCSGCGGDADFSSYSLVYNNTVTSTNIQFISNFHIANDKSVLVEDTFQTTYVINSTQNVIKTTTTLGTSQENTPLSSISGGGKYKVLYEQGPNVIRIYKGDNLLQSKGIDTTQFSDGASMANEGISISNDGKYIGIFGKDTTGIIDRLIIYGGS